MKRLPRPLVALLLILLHLLAGCAVGPEYERPKVLPGDAVLPGQFKEATVPMRPAQPQDTVPHGPWWTVFKDPILDQLMEQLHAANQNLAGAEARYRQAVSAQAQARAALWPSVTGNAATTRSGVSPRGNITQTSTLGLASSWEIDLWGRVRRGAEAATSDAEAAASDLSATRLSLQAQLAASYTSVRIMDAQSALLATTVQAYEKSLTLTQNRYTEGVVSRADVVQAETQLQTARAQAVELELERANLEHALAVLTGRAPTDFSLPPQAQTMLVLPQIPVFLPFTVLERRPDVGAAERRVAAANARIGVARSAFFPDLSLNVSGGYRGGSVHELLSMPQRVWSVGPALAQTLFDSGARRAAVEGAQANYDQVVAAYRQTVLTALQDTEDTLASLRLLAQEAKEQDLAVQAAQRAAQLTLNQYRAGTASYLNVVITQTALLTAQRTALTIQGQRLAAAITLIKAIGGGWVEGG